MCRVQYHDLDQESGEYILCDKYRRCDRVFAFNPFVSIHADHVADCWGGRYNVCLFEVSCFIDILAVPAT